MEIKTLNIVKTLPDLWPHSFLLNTFLHLNYLTVSIRRVNQNLKTLFDFLGMYTLRLLALRVSLFDE